MNWRFCREPKRLKVETGDSEGRRVVIDLRHFFMRKLTPLLFLEATVILVALALGYPLFALGMAVAVPLTIFNSWLVAGALLPDRFAAGRLEMPGVPASDSMAVPGPLADGCANRMRDGQAGVNRLLKRFLLRLGLSLAALALAVLPGAEFMLGVAVALIVEVFTHIFPRGFSLTSYLNR